MGGVDKVGSGDINIAGAQFFELGGGSDEGETGLDHIVNEDDIAAGDSAFNLDNLGLVIGGAVFFDDDDGVLAAGLGVVAGPVDTTLVGSDDGEATETVRFQFGGKERHGGEILVGNAEVAVDQLAVEVDGDELVGAGGFEAFDEEPGVGGNIGVVKPVGLAITHIGDDGDHLGDAVDVEGIDESEQFEEVFGGRIETAKDKGDLEGYQFVEVEGDFAVGKAAEAVAGQVEAGQFTDFPDQMLVASGGKEQILVHLSIMLARQCFRMV